MVRPFGCTTDAVYPRYTLQPRAGRLFVTGANDGRAEVTGTQVSTFSNDTTPYRQEVSFGVDGLVTATGSEVTFTPGR